MQRKNAPLSAAPTAPPKPQLSEFAWGSKGCTAPLPREAEEDGKCTARWRTVPATRAITAYATLAAPCTGSDSKVRYVART